MMTQPKREKFSSNKDTRWDRIRKRYGSNVSANLKSDAVKMFIELDFIGRNQQNILNGDTNIETNLDPVLVMNLRHEMFKKIPRKLPLATVAYSKNLRSCKDHNAAVEDHYIENQLNQFRKHLQKQNEQNKVPVKKLHSLLIDNTDIIKSLECTHKHIEDFYNAPIDALKEVNDLYAGELKKHEKFKDDQEPFKRKINDLNIEQLQNCFNNINTEVQEEEILNEQEDANIVGNEETGLEFIGKRMNELTFNSKLFELKSEPNNNVQRTPSPLENTDEVLQPLKEVLQDSTNLHLRLVKFDDECNIKRQHSICSNTSDGIDSVISDIAAEALKELELEEESKLANILGESNVKRRQCNENSVPNGCFPQTVGEKNYNIIITSTVGSYGNQPLEENLEITNSINSCERAQHKKCSNSEHSKVINDPFGSPTPSRISIMRKYFLRWKHYTTIEKIEREHVDSRADRAKKINIFLNKISNEKKRLNNHQTSVYAKDHNQNQQKTTSENVKINKKYQNKIKMQQDIIDLQRLKLERQERIIMELKLHKLSEEAKEARQELKNELKSVIRSGDPKAKAKAKCLQIIGNLKDVDDENLNELQGKSLMMPKFLQNMQERSLERSIRHEQARQRRQQQEAEREAQKLAQEEAKRLEDEEAKRLRIEALREKRRQEKMAKIIKERERQKYIENQRKAQNFYKKILLNRIGMEGFKRLLQRKRDNLKKCDELRKSLYKKTFFQTWLTVYRIHKARRNQKADELHEKCLKRKYIHLWLLYIHEERSKLNVAIDYNEFKLSETMFQKWWSYTKRMQMIEETKMKQATSHHEWHLKWKVLDCWQRLPQILKLEKETEERRQRWRLKIWELLPDYTPNRDEFNYI